MIGIIVRKELLECRRDGRVLAIAGLIGLLVLVSLVTGWSTHTQQQRHARQAQRADQATFVSQGTKPPHSAAHFGRVAYKVAPALAVFDPGAAPYLGQVIWLEAHRQDPAMFRPAEDSPELRRLADLSVAGVLTMLLPLLIFLMGYGTFAAERERGTLRQVISMGPGMNSLFAGKITMLAAIGIALSTIAVGISIAFALMAPSADRGWGTIVRGIGLIMGYGVYSLVFAGITIAVSARARGATSALLILLSVWTLSVVILPRMAASVADRVYPTPDSGAFWAETDNAIRAMKPPRDSEAYRLAEAQAVTGALGHEVRPEDLASMKLNRQALSLEVGERLGAKVYAEAYEALFATYDSQKRMRRMLSVVSPAIALQHLSSTLAGTDISAHGHFTREAERQRNLIVRRMNEDMMLNGAGRGFDYVATAALWASIPEFVYSPPSTLLAIRSAVWDFLVLMSWCVVALGFARQSARRQSIV